MAKTRKKSPYELHEQYVRISDYLMCNSWKGGRPPREIREKILAKVNKIKAVYDRYVDNIYKLHHTDPWTDNVKDVNNIWFNGMHTKEEYMNN